MTILATQADASNLTGRAQQIVGLQSAAASRSQAMGAIAGGYTMSVQMAETQRTASVGMIEAGRRQQVTGLLADRSFGQQSTNISMRREEIDIRNSQAERNVRTLAETSTQAAENAGGALGNLGGASAPLLPAVRDLTKLSLFPQRLMNETASRIQPVMRALPMYAVRVASKLRITNSPGN